MEIVALVGKLNIGSLSNVDVSGISSGQILVYDGTGGFAAGNNAAAGAGVFNDLTDVDVSGAAAQNIVVLSGTTWIPRAYPPSLGTLQDVTVAVSPSSGDVLTFTGNSLFILSAPPTAVTPSLAALQDTDLSGLISGDTLSFTGSYWQPVASPGAFVQSLSDLLDVDVTGANSGEFFRYRSGSWGPDPVSLQELADVFFASAPTSGQVLSYAPSSGFTASALDLKQASIVTSAGYAAISSKDLNTLYFITSST